jgi:hypothetical protein
LDKPTVVEKLGAYLTGLEIDGLLARRDRIVKLFDTKAAEAGGETVLFDYLSERKVDGP